MTAPPQPLLDSYGRIHDSLRRVARALEDGGALANAGVGLARALGAAVGLVATLA